MLVAIHAGLKRAAIWATAPKCCEPVNLTTLDRRGASEGSADRLGQRLRAVDDEQPRHCRVESARDEIVDERLNGRRIFRCTLGEAERMLVALCIDTERRDQDQIFVQVNAIDLDHQQIEAGKIRRHPLLHPRRRQCHEAARGSRPERAEEEALREGISLGMTLIDTAETYGNGNAQKLSVMSLQVSANTSS
jgi:hypothetical protein